MRKNYFPQLPIALTANLARCSVWKEADISDKANDENHQNKTAKMKVKEKPEYLQPRRRDGRPRPLGLRRIRLPIDVVTLV